MSELRKKYAALYCREDSPYKNREAWEVYDINRDARTYLGNIPVVCHPPCRAWGNFLQAKSFRNKENPWYHRFKEMELALHSLQIVVSVGGIVEHPLDSRLWKLFPLSSQPEYMILTINQYDFGHKGTKPTRFFISPRVNLPEMPWYRGEGKQINLMSKKERETTPDQLIDWFEIILDRITEEKKWIQKLNGQRMKKENLHTPGEEATGMTTHTKFRS